MRWPGFSVIPEGLNRPGVFTPKPWPGILGSKAGTTRIPWRARSRLANTLYAAGRYPEAIRWFRDILARRAAALGPDNPVALRSKTSLANALFASGGPPKACGPAAPRHPGCQGAGLGRPPEKGSRLEDRLIQCHGALTLEAASIADDTPGLSGPGYELRF